MMWSVSVPACTPPAVPLKPVEVLYDYDGPRIFTCTDETGGKFLAYVSDEDETARRLLLVPTNDRVLSELVNGMISVRDALDQPVLWIIDEAHDGDVLSAWRGELRQVPDVFAPHAGVPLLPEHRALLTVRLSGPELVPSRVPASVVKRAVEATSGTLKVLVDFVLRDVDPIDAIGRPRDALRRLYDLPVRNVRFASFELGLADPLVGQQAQLFEEDRKALEHVTSLLRKGLAWLEDTEQCDRLEQVERIAILEALAKLVPPSHGPVREVHVSGRALGQSRSRILDRKHTARVRNALRESRREPELRSYAGRIGELDKDKQTFYLRREDGINIAHFSFTEELLAEIEDAFIQETTVIVAGKVGMREVEVVSIALPEETALRSKSG